MNKYLSLPIVLVVALCTIVCDALYWYLTYMAWTLWYWRYRQLAEEYLMYRDFVVHYQRFIDDIGIYLTRNW
jgi:hypothetical protein